MRARLTLSLHLGIMLRQDAKHRIVIAPIPAGTGNSFVLEIHGVSDWKNSVRRIIRGINVPIDLIKISETGCAALCSVVPIYRAVGSNSTSIFFFSIAF